MLELREVTAGYDGGKVLNSLNLTVPTGKIVALLGANGAGKTTSLRVSSRMLRVTSGAVYLDGDDITGRPPHTVAASGVCYVPETRGIFPGLTVRDNILLFAGKTSPKVAVDRAGEAFPKLATLLGRVAGTMSGGEQQMLALSRAYVSDPKLLLVDELSIGLAPIIVDELYSALRSLAALGLSMLIVEQYATKAMDVADYVYILEKGEIVAEGEPAELSEGTLFDAYFGIETDA